MNAASSSAAMAAARFQNAQLVIDVTSAPQSNLLYRAYSVLLAIGVQVIETRFRLVGDRAVQTFYLAELDDRTLVPQRVSQVLDVLRVTCNPADKKAKDGSEGAAVNASQGRIGGCNVLA